MKDLKSDFNRHKLLVGSVRLPKEPGYYPGSMFGTISSIIYI